LTKENSSKDKGSWFQILLALYLTVILPFAYYIKELHCLLWNRWQRQ